MHTSVTGRKAIETYEGLDLRAYDDGTGTLTIGYGHTSSAGLPEVCKDMTCTSEQADEWLTADLERVEQQVNTLVKVPISQPQFDALVSFEFNTGALGRSTLLVKLNGGDYKSVPAELMRYDHAGGRVMAGLTKRRAAEAVMWASTSPPAPQSWAGWLRNKAKGLFGA